jgi:hypothetical protein
MRAILLFILFTVAPSLRAADTTDPGSVDSASWLKGPLVEVLADGSLKEGKPFAVGFPAFRKLTIRRDPENVFWIVSGTICSTNSGGVNERAAVYAGGVGGLFNFVAMSNLRGEVHFSVYPMRDSQGKTVVPTFLYVTDHPIMSPSLVGEILRQYPLRQTQ